MKPRGGSRQEDDNDTAKGGGRARGSANNNDNSNNKSNDKNGDESPSQHLRVSLSSADHHHHHHHGGHHGSQQWGGSPGRFGHFPKYTKPKIGPAFQCAVPKFVPNNNYNGDDNNNNNAGNNNGESSEAAGTAGGTTSGSGGRTTSTNASRGNSGRGGARGGRGGRGRGGRGSRGGRSGGRGGGGGRGTTSSLVTDTIQDVNLDMLGARPEEMANAAAEQFECNVGKRTIPRGGLCVHRPMMYHRRAAATTTTEDAQSTDLHDDYLTFTRNMFLQTPRPRGEMSIDEIWDENTETKFGGVVLPSEKKKVSRKRKLAADEEVEDGGTSIPPDNMKMASSVEGDPPAAASTETSTIQSQQHSKSSMLPLCGLEDDERMLSFLQANHGGDSDRAKFSIMVNSDRGYAVQRRRQMKKKRKEAQKEAYADATSFSSESWRWRVHQAKSTMLGDYRSSNEPSYHYFDPTSSIRENHLLSTELPWRIQHFGNDDAADDEEMKSEPRNRSLSIVWSTEEIEKAKTIWKSILAYTTDLLSKLGSTESNGVESNKKPYLSDLLDLVGKAHALPTPEEAFGRRDPSARTMSENMNAVIDAIDSGRDCVAKILKYLKDDGEGIELEDLKKSISEIEQSCPVSLFEMDTVKRQIEEAALWEEKLDSNVNRGADSDASDDDAGGDAITEKKCTLEKVERLLSKGRNLTLRPRSLVRLQNRVERAHVLRRRIVVWNEARNQEDPQNIKFIATLIKEANKVDLAFPELLTLTGVHKKAEEWMDRASVAARTTISLKELESLVSTGESLPLNVSDVLEKLQKRLKQAQEWIMCVNEIVPSSDDNIVWLKRIRNALEDSDSTTQLTNLLSEGSRIPVDMDCMKLLQIEIDARNWSMKARPWIPENIEGSDETGVPQKRGKIDDVEEHLDRATTLRDRLWFSDEEKSQWVLDGESELSQMLEMAETWFDKYDDVISYDNRSSKKKGKLQLPISKLHAIAEEVSKIPLNLGNPATRMSRIYSQAETWIGNYYALMKRCGVECSYVPSSVDTSVEAMELLNIDDLDEAVSDADSDIPFDLSEVVEMRNILEKAQLWMDKATAIAPSDDAPKKGGKEKHSLEEITELLQEAPTILVDIAADVDRLLAVQETVESWRIMARQNLRDIISAFNQLQNDQSTSTGSNSAAGPTSIESATRIEAATSSTNSERPRSDSNINDPSIADATLIGNGSNTAFALVSKFIKSVKSMTVETQEGNIAEELSEVISWFTRASKMIESAAEVYDKRNFTKLDKIIQSGQKLIKFTRMKVIAEDTTLIYDLRESWAAAVKGDIERLLDLQRKRDTFLEWCKKADEIISSSDKKDKVPISTLNELEQQSSGYPSTSDVVTRVRKRAKDGQEWLKVAKEFLDSGEKIPIEDAKDVITAGDKLNITCDEYKTLRNALKATRSWLLKVKKSTGDEGQTVATSITELINEHNNFLVTAEEEYEKLKQTMCGYCICRQPYEGFMIGCDSCEEWYHGPCVGISEGQAEKFDKYVCVRCSTLRVYKDNVSAIAAVVRKWSSATGLVKARTADDQRYGRKTRQADRDYGKHKEQVEKYKVEMKFLQQRIKSQADAANTHTNGLTKEETALLEKIQKAQSAADTIAKRMEGYRNELIQRKSREATENSLSSNLKKWCRMIKKEILAPATKEEADSSMPTSELMSAPMEKAKTYAETLGIIDILDIDTALNSFKILCWCLTTLGALRRKPRVEEVRRLIKHSESAYFKLPESKCVRMLRSMSSRAQIWQTKAEKALVGVPGGKEKYDINVLNEIMLSARQIPLTMPEQARIWNTIQDGGSRYCVCGGPGDGSFMLGCDNCDKWFHGTCMKISKEAGEALTKWVCPPCSTKVSESVRESIKAEKKAIAESEQTPEPVPEVKLVEDISPHAPSPTSLWPPFGLRDTEKAIEAFGKLGDSDSEDFVAPPVNRYHLVVASQHALPGPAGAPNLPRPAQAVSNATPIIRNGVAASKPVNNTLPYPATVNQSLPVPVSAGRNNTKIAAKPLPPKKLPAGNYQGTSVSGKVSGKSNGEMPAASTASMMPASGTQGADDQAAKNVTMASQGNAAILSDPLAVANMDAVVLANGHAPAQKSVVTAAQSIAKEVNGNSPDTKTSAPDPTKAAAASSSSTDKASAMDIEE